MNRQHTKAEFYHNSRGLQNCPLDLKGGKEVSEMRKRILVLCLLLVFLTSMLSAYTKEDATKGVLDILNQYGFEVKSNENNVFIGEKDCDGFIVQLTVRLTMKLDSRDFFVTLISRLPDFQKYTPAQVKEVQTKIVEALIKKRLAYLKSLDKYVKSHYALNPEIIETMKTEELVPGLSFDQVSFIMKEKYYRYESLQTISAVLTGLANVLDALGGGTGAKYQQQEFDNDVHCKTSTTVDKDNPDQKVTIAYYYYRDPKSNQSFWLNGHYVDVHNYNAEAGETPIIKAYFVKNRLVSFDELLEVVSK
jgi:hypothetical protein